MSANGPRADHPVDELPSYARGTASRAEEIARHLDGCAACRAELEIVRALADAVPAPLTDIERRAVYRAFEARRTAAAPATAGRRAPWLTATWRAAAAVALVLTGVGVWRAVEAGRAAPGWNPDRAVADLVRDVADLEVGAGEVRAALGGGLLDEPGLVGRAWDGLDREVPIPWEEER